jgi:hypothetical protein
MTPEEQNSRQNQITASLFRQLYYSRMLNSEHEHFLKLTSESGIKNVLHRMKTTFHNGITQILSHLPIKSQKIIRDEMNVSEEKICAMCNVIERMSLLPEDKVLELEKDFTDLIQINY